MTKLSDNFSSEEFECKCGCGFDEVDKELVDVLQSLREALEEPITITSACRCPEHNKAVGGSPRSQHLKGTAADIIVKGCTPAFIYNYLDNLYPDKYGIGKYKSFTHLDVRSKKARW